MRYIIPELAKAARKLHGRCEVHGMQISIENAKGSTRHWYDEHDNETGSTLMSNDYGYIRGTLGIDANHVDAYVGPYPESTTVFIVTQMRKPDFSEVDEQKVMLGFHSAKKAKAAYLAHYDDARFFGSMKAMNVQAFKRKVFDRNNHGGLVKAVSHKYTSKKADGKGGWTYEYAPGSREHVSAAMDAIEAKHGVSLSVGHHQGDVLTLSKVVVPKELRSTGIGSKVMQELHEYADKHGKTVALTPSSDFGGSKARLREFYKRHGYVDNKGRNKDFAISDAMYRPLAKARMTIGALALFSKANMPPGSGWTAIPGGKRGGYRKRKGAGWDYWYPDGHTHEASPPKYSDADFSNGAFDKDATHWKWKQTNGELKAWTAGGIDPQSHAPVKTGGRFAKLYQIHVAEDPKHPGFAVLKDVTTGELTMMQHNRIYPVEYGLPSKRVQAPPEGPKAPWVPGTSGATVRPSSGRAAAGKRAPVFEGSRANEGTGLHAIETGVYPMASIERWEMQEDGTKKKIKLEAIGVPDHGKNLLVKEFEPLIAGTAKTIAKKYALQMQYERGTRGQHSTNVTLAELQRAGIEGMLDAIERYDAKGPFASHARQFVTDHIRLAAARERLGGVTLPMRHQRNLGRYIAARAQASKDLGVDDPSPDQVAPYFRLLKRHLHPQLSGAQANEAVPASAYKIAAAHEGTPGAVKRSTGERTGDQPAHVQRDTITHPGKLEWTHLYDSFLKGQSSASELFDEDKFALPGLGMGLGYSPEERVAIRQSVQVALDSLADFSFASPGRTKVTYKGDAGEMLTLRLGLRGDDEMSVAQIASQVPIFANGKQLGQRAAEGAVAEMLEHAVEHAREATIGRDAKVLMERAEERLVAPVEVPHGPTWHEVVRKRADAVTPQQVAEYRGAEKARLGDLLSRSQERADQARESDKAMHALSLRGAQEAMRRIERMGEDEIRLKIAQRPSPETAEMRRLMTQSVAVDMPAPRGREYGHAMMTMTDLGTGAQRNVRVRTLRDLRHAEDRELEKSERAKSDATLTTGMLHEAINFPRTMRLLVAPDAQLASAPTIARRTVELLSGLGDVR